MSILVNLQNSDFSLSHEKNDGYGSLVSCKTDTDVGSAGIEKKFSFFVHLEEQIACFNKKFLLIGFVYLNIFFIVWY